MFKIKFIITLFLALLSSSLVSEEISLRDSLRKARSGDYLVISQNKSLSLLHVFQALEDTLVLEEISAPGKLKSEIKGNWQKWLDEGAPGHTSWIMYELNLGNKEIEDIYSFAQRSWKKVFPQEQIFPTLIDLKFETIPEYKRKRVGPPLPSEMIDDRPLWSPPIFFEGKKVRGAKCSAYSARWPNDGSELSGKKIDIFLVDEPNDLPCYFPMWMQVTDKIAQAKLRVIDSGQALKSPNKSFPTPPLELKACGFTKEGHLQFQVRTHPQFGSYTLFIKEFDGPQCQSIPFEIERSGSSREIKFVVTNENLNNKMKLDKLYTFIFEPSEHIHLSVETPKPIKLPKQYATK